MIRVLGPVELTDGDRSVVLPQRVQRALLGLLVSAANEVASAEMLIGGLWQEPVSERRLRNLQAHIYQLRRQLAAAEPGRAGERIRTVGTGYRLAINATELDSAIFAELTGQARKLGKRGDLPGAARCYRHALGLWRGPALADVADTSPSLRTFADQLDEQRLCALEERIDIDLALGLHAEVVSELSGLVIRHPLRERLSHRLMLSLYRSGRQAEALDAYHAARRRLRDELGLDPGPELQDLLRRILAGDADLHLASMPVRPAGQPPAERIEPLDVVPRQLPAGVRTFAGRQSALAELDGLLEQPATGGGMAIGLITGPGGVGKTTLAVHWAHRVASAFPDGQLYTNLRGFGPAANPATSGDVIRDFLGALQVPPGRMPASLQASADLYRSLIAGRRMLLVLDNAADYDQVRPLLPGTASCVVLVTSRLRLTGLLVDTGASVVALDRLGDADAHKLLASRLGAARLAAEPDDAADLVRLCDGLPLALAIVAARAAVKPQEPIRGFAAQMRLAESPLDALTDGAVTGGIRDAFSWSYRQLSAPAARMFRLIGLHAGPDISLAAAASLAGAGLTAARDYLDELLIAHLVTEPSIGRFVLHDLLRSYASELARGTDSPAELRMATNRVLDYYVHTAQAAELILHPMRSAPTLRPPLPGVVTPEVAPLPFDDYDSALAWLQAEYRVLLAAVAEAEAWGFDLHSWQLPWALRTFIDRRGHWPDMIGIQRIGVAAARRLADVSAEAECHRSLGLAYMKMGIADEAHDHLQEALIRCQQTSDWYGLAHIELDLARLLEAEGKLSEALDYSQDALEHYRRAGQAAGEANALNAVAWYHALLGDYEQALLLCPQALTALTECGDRHAQAGAWDTLGFAHLGLRNYAKSVACYHKALVILRELGDVYIQARTLSLIGDVHQAAGDIDAARESWLVAKGMLKELRHADAVGVGRKLAAAQQPGTGERS